MEAQLFPRTFRNFAREFSSIVRTARQSLRWRSRTGLLRPPFRAIPPCRAVTSRSTCQQFLAIGVSAQAASVDGHASQAADRFTSARARRAAAARAVRSAGTVSPVPKYISSGVCPRNAECGST